MNSDAQDPCSSGLIIPIIVEELDSNSLDKYDLAEFREAQTVTIQNEEEQEQVKNVETDVNYVEYDAERDHELTNKFLNGELTFDQFSAQMEGTSSSEEEDETDITKQKSEISERVHKPHKSKVRRNQRTQLPPALLGLMGEANLRCARGEMEIAENICFELIRQVPTAQEPFITLAQIYEISNPEKSLQYSLIAAHVCPHNAEQWVRLAIQSEDLGNIKQAIICYDKSLKVDPKDVSLHRKLIKLVETTNDTKMTLRCYLRYLEYIPLDEAEEIVQVAKMIATNYHHDNNISKALKALEIAYSRVPQHFKDPDINLLLELMIGVGKYQSGLQVLAQHANVVIEGMTELYESKEGVDQKFFVVNCTIPDDLILDLRVKLIICLVHLRADHLFNDLLHHLLIKDDKEEYGDLYLELAEALMKESYFEAALKLLCPLIESNNFSLAAVWLRYAECLQACGRINEAITSYQTVIHLAPKHLEPRMTVSILLREQNKFEEALKALEQDEDLDMLDPGLLFERCKLLRIMGDELQLLQVGQLLLSRHCVRIRNAEEAEALTRLQEVVRKKIAIKEVRMARGELYEDVDAPIFLNANEPSIQDEWLLLKELLQIAFKKKQFGLCQRISFSALGSKRFKEYIRELEFTCLIICLANQDGYLGFNIIRELVQKNYEKHRVWNLYNQIIQRADDVRHSKFLMRFLCRNGHNLNPAVNILTGNNCLVAGTYKYALSEYVSRYKHDGSALHAFMVGVTMFQMACQKFSAKRSSLITQGIAFFTKYAAGRGKEAQHEIHYNTGRAFHQLGFSHVAIHHYLKVLEITNSLIESRPEILDLRKETAYNIHLIYAKSGSHDLARMYLQKYIVL